MTEQHWSNHAPAASFQGDQKPKTPIAAIARYRWVDALRKLTKTEQLHEGDAVVYREEEAILSRLSLDSLLTRQSPALVKVNVHRGLKKLVALVESE